MTTVMAGDTGTVTPPLFHGSRSPLLLHNFEKTWVEIQYVYIYLKRSHFWGFSFEDIELGQKYRFATFNVCDRGNPPLSNVATLNSIRHSVPVLWREVWTHFITMTTLFTFEAERCKNFKTIFLKTLFFKSSTSIAYISESSALGRLEEVSIDPKFYLILGSGHNSIAQNWDLFRWMYRYIYATGIETWMD